MENGTKVVALGKPTGGRLLQFGEITAFAPEVTKTKIGFRLTGFELPDLEPYYKEFCTPPAVGRSIQNIIPIDFNSDGRLDLLLTLWCSPTSAVSSGQASEYFGPTPSRLIVLLQMKNGDFVDGTFDVFGLSKIEQGGVENNPVIHDLNKDGRLDIILGLGREDGRKGGDPQVTYKTDSLLLISEREKYIIRRFGIEAWTLGVVPLDNAFGGIDFVTVNVLAPRETWRFERSLISLPALGWVTTDTLFFKREVASGRSTQAFVSAQGSDFVGVVHWGLVGEEWVRKSQLGYQPKKHKFYYQDGATVSETLYVTLDGKDVSGLRFSASCELRRTSERQPEALFLLFGWEIVGGYKGETVDTRPVGGDVKPFVKLISFTLGEDGELRQSESRVQNEFFDADDIKGLDCRDVNNDGFQDIIVYGVGRGQVAPIVYLNDRFGSFDRVSRDSFPPSPAGWYEKELSYQLIDLNNDGIIDLIYFPISGRAGEKNQLMVHFGTRYLD